MYRAMNFFQVKDGFEAEFEQRWKDRETYLDQVPGFQKFNLLKGKEGQYISYSEWESEASFMAWTQSEAFKKAHSQGGLGSILLGHPKFSGYQVIL